MLGKLKAPTSAETLTGAVIRTAEAVQTRNHQYPAFGCGTQEEFHRWFATIAELRARSTVKIEKVTSGSGASSAPRRSWSLGGNR